MQPALRQLTAAVVLATALLLQAVHCAPAAGSTEVRRPRSPSIPLDDYLVMRALLLNDNRLPVPNLRNSYPVDQSAEEMGRSRRAKPIVESFEPLPIELLRRMMKDRIQEQTEQQIQNRINDNTDFFKAIGRR
ncbi:uncharacterized protein [Diadema setosum]|uniref:uncharacterized protein n=1 Tax=Diadema setosum TaxID=31175 RepID=UPI003B3A0454